MTRTVDQWNRIRASLKKEFEAMNITSCESCGESFNLRFCHRMKRRFINDEQELRYVALLCERCDYNTEFSGHENLYKAITAIVERRTGYDALGDPFYDADVFGPQYDEASLGSLL